jgi:hypothetical protein
LAALPLAAISSRPPHTETTGFILPRLVAAVGETNTTNPGGNARPDRPEAPAGNCGG